MSTMSILAELMEAEEQAWDSLARYKFVMFGYWAGVWVHLNRIAVGMGHQTQPNPWSHLVKEAQIVRRSQIGDARRLDKGLE